MKLCQPKRKMLLNKMQGWKLLLDYKPRLKLLKLLSKCLVIVVTSNVLNLFLIMLNILMRADRGVGKERSVRGMKSGNRKQKRKWGEGREAFREEGRERGGDWEREA